MSRIVSQAQLASRIARATAVDPEGRYDMASKVEVKAFFAEEVENIKWDQKYIPLLEARIAELELSVWARIKRAFGPDLRRGSTKTTIINVAALEGEELAAELRKASDRHGRAVGMPPEFAAKYGEQKGT